MNDQQLEQRLRAWYRDEIGFTEPAPISLSGGLPEIAAQRGGWRWVIHRPAFATAVLLLLTLAAATALLILGLPPPPQPLPPSSINLWMVITNESPDLVEYSMSGSDASGGGVGGCAVSVSSNVMSTPWWLHVDGEGRVLTSEHPAAAYEGLATGGDVVLRLRVAPDGAIDVSPLVRGTGLGADQSRPESCVGYVEPPAGAEVPPELEGLWRTRVAPASVIEPGTYHVYLLSGWAEYQVNGSGEYLQGSITQVTPSEIQFSSSPVCARPGTYGWILGAAQSVLRLAPLEDECAERRALFDQDLERVLDEVLVGGRRHFAYDFGRPFAVTVPEPLTANLDAGDRSGRALGYAYYRVSGLGIEIHDVANTTPATCNGPEGWLTGGVLSGPEPVLAPEIIRDLERFRGAFAAWDTANPDVVTSAPRDLSIGGLPAVVVEVTATALCGNEPGVSSGMVLERDYAIDLGDRVLIFTIGPGVFEHEMFVGIDRHESTFDPSLLTLGDQFVMSLEFL